MCRTNLKLSVAPPIPCNFLEDVKIAKKCVSSRYQVDGRFVHFCSESAHAHKTVVPLHGLSKIMYINKLN